MPDDKGKLSLEEWTKFGIVFSGHKLKSGVLVFSLTPEGGEPYHRIIYPAGYVQTEGSMVTIYQHETVTHFIGPVSFDEDDGVVDIPLEKFGDYKMKVNCSLMLNGEYRFRLMGEDGAGYIRTWMPAEKPTDWQNAHLHGQKDPIGPNDEPLTVGTIEFIQVEKGYVVTVDQEPGQKEPAMHAYIAGENWISRPGVAHNICQVSGSVTHCIKFGKDVPNPERNNSDWYPADELDAWCKALKTDKQIVAALPANDVKKIKKFAAAA